MGERVGARLREHDPSVLETLNDRAQDVWRPPLRIADFVGGEWPSLARQAAIELSRINEDEDSERVELLRDIRQVLSSEGVERLSSKTPIDRLSSLDESRWSPFRYSHRINPRERHTGLNAARVNRDNLGRPWANWTQGTLHPQVPGSIPGWPTINDSLLSRVRFGRLFWSGLAVL